MNRMSRFNQRQNAKLRDEIAEAVRVEVEAIMALHDAPPELLRVVPADSRKDADPDDIEAARRH